MERWGTSNALMNLEDQAEALDWCFALMKRQVLGRSSGTIFGKRDLLAIDHIMLALCSKYEIIS